jgi:hypothetical protein
MDSEAVFAKLKSILKPYELNFDKMTDNDNTYYLEYKQKDLTAKPTMFAAVMIKKNYISLYYMPVYYRPELLVDISPSLKKHMQGKSCFNFTDENDQSIDELSLLISQTAKLRILQD